MEGGGDGKEVVLSSVRIEPDSEAMLSDPLTVEIEVLATKSIPNIRWQAQFVADLANAKQAGGVREGSSKSTPFEQGERHTFSFTVDNFVNDLCEGIEEQILLNVGVLYIILYSGDTEIERFAFVTYIRRRRVEGRHLWRYVFNPLAAPAVSS